MLSSGEEQAVMEEAEAQKEQLQFEVLIQGLIDHKVGCCDDFFDPTVVSGLRDRIHRFDEAGEMQAAGIGKKGDYQQNKSVRGDSIKWIQSDSDNPFEARYLQKIGNFLHYLNRTCYTALNNFESHYAHYPQHSFYKRHLDQFKQDSGRKYSIVLYLNEDWQTEDGGILSVYPSVGPQRDISPQGGRMVFFKSDELEHEVHPSPTQNRISIAGWLKS